MSLDIWMRCGGPSRVAPIVLSPWRVVEAQHQVSTRILVDDLAEQQILEEIIDEVKPPRPVGPGFDGLDYLLWTPFRYPPHAHGSRFATQMERSVWYGAKRVETSLAEKAFYLLLFAASSAAVFKNLACEWSAFQASVDAPRGIDLCDQAFARFHPAICSKTSYADSQPLGAAMRTDGVQAFLYPSARCPLGGAAVGLFEPVFAAPKVTTPATWKCWVTATGCEVKKLNDSQQRSLTFQRSDFEVDGHLASPFGRLRSRSSSIRPTRGRRRR